MSRKKILFTLAIVSLLALDLQASEGDSIIYKAKNKIEWSDFQMKPDNSDSGKVFFNPTIVTFTKKVDIWWGYVTVESFAGFVSNECWVKPQFQSDLLLEYVQLKYDIANLYAKKAEKKINKKKINAAFTGKIAKIIEKHIEEMNLVFKKIDEESDFGNNQEITDTWKIKALDESF
jgi:hypothetical protein